LSGAFYFQKAQGAVYLEQPVWEQNAPPSPAHKAHTKKPLHNVSAKPLQPKLSVDCGEVRAILGTEEGQPNAKKIYPTVPAV
jgi:hypothetical protein